jgi:hypothetical protein
MVAVYLQMNKNETCCVPSEPIWISPTQRPCKEMQVFYSICLASDNIFWNGVALRCSLVGARKLGSINYSLQRIELMNT